MRKNRWMTMAVSLVMTACLALTGCAGQGAAPAGGNTAAADKTGNADQGTEKGAKDAGQTNAAAGKDGAENQDGKQLHVAILATATFGNQAFVDVALTGCQRAEQELGIKLSKIENCQPANTVDTLRGFAQGDIDVFIMTSGAYADSIRQLAAEFPDKIFVSGDMSMEEIANVISVGYREQEAAFLSGALVSMMTESKKVAFIGGQPGGSMDRFEVGYSCGAKYVDPEVNASVAYVGNFNDVNKAKELAAMLYNQGNDWLVPAAGASNLGVFQAAQEKNHYTMGAADGQFHLMPENIVASQVKRIDNVCYMIIEDLLKERKYVGHALDLGIKEGGVGLLYNPDEKISGIIPDDVKGRLEELEQDINDGRIMVPKTREELEAFPYPVQ